MLQRKKKLDFKAFNDGIVKFQRIDEDDNLIQSTEITLHYSESVVGIKRYYAARSIDVEIERVIEVRQNKAITGGYAAIIGNTRYKIEQVQHVDNSFPKTTVISLSQRGLYEGEYGEV